MPSSYQDTFRHKGLRSRLVDELRRKGIHHEQVLKAINAVPRHWFLDSVFVNAAYEDKAMPIGEGQTISQPYTVAFQTQLIDPQPNDYILEIGTGSGYQACVILAMGAKVCSIERNEKLYNRTKSFLASIGADKDLDLFCGDGTVGLPMHSPFDKILITAGAPVVPQSLIDQLVIGGVLVVPVGNQDVQVMKRITKLNRHQVKEENFTQFKFVPLLGKEGW